MHRVFAAALLVATMVGGAALVPSGASAATVPGPSAIPSTDAIRSVDPEVVGVEQVGHRHCYHHPCYRKFKKFSYYRPRHHYRKFSYYKPHYPRYRYYSYYDDFDYYPYYHKPYYPHYYHSPGFSIVIGGGRFGGRWGDDD
jgi:hypothetical protein